MPTFGVTTTDGASEAPGANYKIVSKFNLSVSGSATKISLYMSDAGVACHVRGFVYADSAGPAALKAVGSEFTTSGTGGAAWYDSTFSPVTLPPGDYWIGFFSDNGGIRYYQHNVSSNRKYKAETYSSSPADPFGSVDGTDNLEVTAYVTYDLTAQHLAPSADSVDGAWTDQAGGTSLAAAIDEATASDSDYIRSEIAPSNSGCRVKVATGTDPVSSTGHIIHWRAGKDVTAGATINMTVKLYQGGGNAQGGGTLIASFARNGVDAFTTYDETLSGGQADSITDYSDLYLEFFATSA